MEKVFENVKKIGIQVNISSNYLFLSVLGEGAFSKVYLSVNTSGSKSFSIKEISKHKIMTSNNGLVL